MNINQLKGIRADEDYINLNSMASFLSIIALILFPYSISKIKVEQRLFFVIFNFLVFFAIILSNSRGAILSLLVGFLFILYKYKKKYFIKVLVISLFLIPLIFIEPFSSIINIYFRTERLSTGRDWILESTYYAVKDHLIFGVGPAATKFELYRNIPFMLGSIQELFINHTIEMGDFGNAHNFYLFFLSDLGILGFISAIFFPYVFLKMSSSLLNSYKERNLSEYLLILGITGAGISVFVRGIFEWGNIISYGTLEKDLPLWILVIIISYIFVNRNNKSFNFEISFPFFRNKKIIFLEKERNYPIN
jgi:O-antigen ligase